MNLYIGLMSGTSVDGIDAALVEFNPTQPLPLLKATHYHPWPLALRDQLLYLSQQTRELSTLHEVATLDIQVGELFAQAVLALLKQANLVAKQITAIGSPGQTLYHQPNAYPPYTWQLGDPNVIAQLTEIPTVADFRRRDVAAGGQGAPLTPAFHQAAFRSAQETRVVLNIGGIANITVLPEDPQLPVIGFDTGPGNALLDAHIYQHQQIRVDNNGAWAARGQVQVALLQSLLSDSYFTKPAPKSTGRDYFNLDWLGRYLVTSSSYSPIDIQATLSRLTIESITQAVLPYSPARLLVCGGGVHNSYLMNGLATQLSGCVVESTLHHGIDPDWVEAVSFAWFAQQRLAQQPNNLPSVTGARTKVVMGGIYI